MSSLLIAVSQGDDRWVGLPIYTMRKFFHTGILIRKDRGIKTPQDLRGKKVGVPEYRLRRLINQGLGHRNFNSFVNHYRIAEARAALADPAQAAVPVLTIALDAGFSSLGPFNRAFKAETGLTPSDFRRQNLGISGIGEPIPESASRISNPASGNVTAP